MKELIPQLILTLIGCAYIIMAALAIYVAILAHVNSAYFGIQTPKLDVDELAEMHPEARVIYVKNHILAKRSMRTGYFMFIGAFIFITLIEAYITIIQVNLRWVDILDKIGLLIIFISILYHWRYNNNSTFILKVIYLNTVLFSVLAGIYIGLSEYIHAIFAMIMYVLVFRNYLFIKEKIRRQQQREEIEKDGINIDGLHLKIKITPHENKPGTEL